MFLKAWHLQQDLAGSRLEHPIDPIGIEMPSRSIRSPFPIRPHGCMVYVEPCSMGSGSVLSLLCSVCLQVFFLLVYHLVSINMVQETWSAVSSGYHRIQSECQTCSKSVIHRVPTKSDGVWSAIFDETGTLSWEDSYENYKFNLDTPTSLPWAPMSPSIYETKSIPKSM